MLGMLSAVEEITYYNGPVITREESFGEEQGSIGKPVGETKEFLTGSTLRRLLSCIRMLGVAYSIPRVPKQRRWSWEWEGRMSGTISDIEARYFIEYVYDEVYHRGNLDALAGIYSDPYIAHGGFLHPDGERRSISQMAEGIALVRVGFPDLRLTVEKVIASGGEGAVEMCCYYRFKGTHRGWFQGLAPTFRRVDVAGMDLSRISGGKIVEGWASLDVLGIMCQLGVLPRDLLG